MGVPISKKWKHMQTGPKCEPSYVGARHDGTLYKKGDNQYLHAILYLTLADFVL